MGTLLARNATILVTMDDQRRELPGAGLFARDGVIEQVGPSAELPSDADVVLELPGHLLLPGLVNCHHHLDQVLTRNLPAGQNTNLFPWLRAHYRLWGRRTPPASRTATIVGLAELALSGATTVFDHAYVFGNGCRVDDQIAAAAEVGTRFVVSRGSMSLGESRGGLPPDDCVEDEDAILADSQRVIERYHDSRAGSMCQIALAPCSPFSVTPELMRDSAALARRYGVRLHTHLAETLDEERYTLETLGRRPVDYLDSLGWVADDVWFAHAVHVDAAEIRLFADRGTEVCHCPTSNMRLAAGIAPAKDYLAAGGAGDRVVDLRPAPGSRLDDRPRGPGAGHPRRRRSAGPHRHRLARTRQVRRFLHPRPGNPRLRRRPVRPGGRGRLLRPTARPAHSDQRSGGSRRRRGGHPGPGARHHRAQPACRGPRGRG